MRVGDKLYCHTDVISEEYFSGQIWIEFSAGKSYDIIIYREEKIMLHNNDVNRLPYSAGSRRWFYKNTASKYYYGNWFYTLQELRMIKLEKLNEGR